MMHKSMAEQSEATEVRRPNYNDPACNRDCSYDDELYMRRCSDRSKPAPSDPHKKSMMSSTPMSMDY